MTLPIERIHPILVPQVRFQDRFGHPNAYIEMNPSMHIDQEGRVTILVRCVNYRKFKDKAFTLYQNQSNSTYYISYGTIKDNEPLNLETFDISPLSYTYNLPTYPTYWTGLEDIRFVDGTTLLATIPECTPSGNPTIFKAKLDINRIRDFSPCLPNKSSEKNWMPFQDLDGTHKVVYSVSPFVVKSLESEECESLSPLKELEGYHGSTNGIYFDSKTILFLVHLDKVHRWLKLDLQTRTIIFSKEFVFFKHSHIEFPCSLATYKDRLFVSLGVNDDKAFIAEIKKDHIETLF
jgi:hypothetical protein